jgi:hypothetical protein
MAAINVIRQQRAVHIISDGALCDNAGIVCEIGPNAFALPHLRTALAIRGPTHFMPFLVHRLSRECRSFDDILNQVARTALEVHSSFPMAIGSLGHGSVEPDFDIVAAGWSTKTDGPASYLVSSQQRVVAKGVTASPWQLLKLPDILIAPPIAEKQITATGWKVPYSAESFVPETDGVALLKAQRFSRREVNSRSGIFAPIHVVGGFVQITSVSSGGVSSKVPLWWSDAVGRKIEPQL